MVRISLHRCRLLNKRKNEMRAGKILNINSSQPADPTLECIDEYFNENYMEVEDDDDEG